MQYYGDGFRGGDPDKKNAANSVRARDVFARLPEKVDVLIAGTGPAGLCLGAQLSVPGNYLFDSGPNTWPP